MQQLIINTPPTGAAGTTDWLATTLIATGLRKDGYEINSAVTRIKAADVPPEHEPALNKVVAQLIADGDADGDKRCEAAFADIIGNDDPDAARVVQLTIHWQWPDGKMQPPQVVALDDADVVALVAYLLTPEAYTV